MNEGTFVIPSELSNLQLLRDCLDGWSPDADNGRTPVVTHISNISKMSSEVSYFLSASLGHMHSALGAVESHWGVLIKGEASSGL